MMMSGRGSWAVSGIGGTLSYDGTKPGPYYRIPADGDDYIGRGSPDDVNERAVQGAVRAYQRALRRRLGNRLAVDGLYSVKTADAVKVFQTQTGAKPWGGIGPETSKALLYPDLRRRVTALRRGLDSPYSLITPAIVCGIIKQESQWDAGAVGYSDEHDIGLAQINSVAHPEYSEDMRLQPITAFDFVFNYLKDALAYSHIETVDDAIASYNLGIGGARRWISQDRPSVYNPLDGGVRYVWDYIDKIKTGCQT